LRLNAARDAGAGAASGHQNALAAEAAPVAHEEVVTAPRAAGTGAGQTAGPESGAGDAHTRAKDLAAIGAEGAIGSVGALTAAEEVGAARLALQVGIGEEVIETLGAAVLAYRIVGAAAEAV
jgi:hypothetical protein